MPQYASRREKDKWVKDGAHIAGFHQVKAYIGMETTYTIPISPPVSSTALGNNSQIFFDLETWEVPRIDNICIRWTITAINDTKLLPIFYWCRRIVIEAEKGTSDELEFIYPESVLMYYQTALTAEKRDYWSKLGNFSYIKDTVTGTEQIWSKQKNIIRAGETKDIYMIIPSGFLQSGIINLHEIVGDLRFRFEMNNDINLDGTTANDYTLDNIHLVIGHHEESAVDKSASKELAKAHHKKWVYLDCEKLSYNDRTLNANTIQKYNLDQFSYMSPFLLFCIKPNTMPNASDNSIYDYQDLGDQARIDMEDSGGRSLVGQGTPVRSRELYQQFNDQTNNPPLKGLYMVNFSEDIKHSYIGAINGFHQFTGKNFYLRLDMDSEKVTPKFTLSGVPAGASDPFNIGLDYPSFKTLAPTNSSVSSGVIATAVNTFSRFAKDNNLELGAIAGTGGETLDADNTMQFEFTKGDNIYERFGLLNDTMPNNITTTSVVNYGKNGWNSGADYTIEIFCFKYKEILISKNGKLRCRNLGQS